jgi:hypothetical protein
MFRTKVVEKLKNTINVANKKLKFYFWNGPWRPTELWDVEDPTSPRKLSYRWQRDEIKKNNDILHEDMIS